MRLIEQITSGATLTAAGEGVRKNKGAAGVDRMETDAIRDYLREHMKDIRRDVVSMKYKPQPVKRVYIPKPNGKQRPLGIPVVMDRVLQEATAMALEPIFDPEFSEHSYGFRHGRSAHDAVRQALEYINDGYDWIVDLDIEKFFDRVNHDKLISIIRTKVNEKETLHLIREFLKAKVNQILRGWINYFHIGSMKGFLRELGPWLRHKIRVVILKQWKRPRTIFKNLATLNRILRGGFTPEEIRQTANSRLGSYRSAGMRTFNFLLSPKVLGTENKKRGRPGLVGPLELYCSLNNNS